MKNGGKPMFTLMLTNYLTRHGLVLKVAIFFAQKFASINYLLLIIYMVNNKFELKKNILSNFSENCFLYLKEQLQMFNVLFNCKN